MAIRPVEFVEFQFNPEIRSGTIFNWCDKNIGRRGTRWDISFHSSGGMGTFEFSRAEDAVLFTLKWT